MRILDLMLKDLYQWIQDWKAPVFLLVMPIVFTLLFGFAFSGGGSDDTRIPIAYLDQDGGALSEPLHEMLSQSSALRLEVLTDVDAGELNVRVDEGDYPAALIVPSGYSQAMMAGESQPLTLITDTASPSANTLEQLVQSAVGRFQRSVQAARISQAAYVEQTGSQAPDGFFEEALQEALQAWQDPPVVIESQAAQPEGLVEDQVYGDNAFAHSSPGMMLQFAIAGLIGAAEIMVLERRSRCLQRLMTTPFPRFGILVGHFLAMFVMIMLQMLVLTGFGDLVLGLTYWQTPLATGALLVMTGLFVASMGLLIGVLSKTPDQTIIFSLLPMFVLAGLGGAWIPLEFTGETFQTIGHFTPLAWAMDGLKNLLIRGLGWESILAPLGVLGGYAIVLFGLAAWRFANSQES